MKNLETASPPETPYYEEGVEGSLQYLTLTVARAEAGGKDLPLDQRKEVVGSPDSELLRAVYAGTVWAQKKVYVGRNKCLGIVWVQTVESEPRKEEITRSKSLVKLAGQT